MMNRYTRIIIRLRRKKDKENNIFDDIKKWIEGFPDRDLADTQIRRTHIFAPGTFKILVFFEIKESLNSGYRFLRQSGYLTYWSVMLNF